MALLLTGRGAIGDKLFRVVLGHVAVRSWGGQQLHHGRSPVPAAPPSQPRLVRNCARAVADWLMNMPSEPPRMNLQPQPIYNRAHSSS